MTKTAYLETLSKNVAALRKAKGWNQEELARKAGLSQKVISNLESASEKKIHPTLNTIVSVADAFGVSVFLLLTQLNDSRIEQMKVALAPQAISRLVDIYLSLEPDSRQTVDRIVELESRTH